MLPPAPSSSRGLQKYRPANYSSVDTIFCSDSKVIRAGSLSGGFQVSSTIELLLDGRSIREFGWEDAASGWTGSLRCDTALYRILAQVKEVKREAAY